MTAVEPYVPPATVAVPARCFKPDGLELPPGLTYDQWSELGVRLAGAQDAVRWWTGDWLSYGERQPWSDLVEQAAPLGYASETLRGLRYVSERVPSVRRRTSLSHGHHRVVAPLEAEDQVRLLDAAERDGLTRTELRELAKVYKRALDLPDDADAATIAEALRDPPDLVTCPQCGHRFDRSKS